MDLKRLCRCWLPSPVVLCLVAGAAGSAHGQDAIGGFLRRLLGGGDANAVVPEPMTFEAADVPADFANQYTPLLTKLMTTELHFANKVCGLDADQLRTLKDAGRAKVAVISKTYERHQNRNGNSNWPDARGMLTDTFQKQLDEMLPAEAAQRYREEVTARQSAKQEAAREMMTMLIDRKLSLTPEQYEQADQTLSGNWDPDWSTNMQVYLYDEYAPMPDANLLQPLLTERQREIWASRANHGRISFGWEQDLGLIAPWGDVGDLEVGVNVPQKEPPAEEIRDEVAP